jgi:hypothetical protein
MSGSHKRGSNKLWVWSYWPDPGRRTVANCVPCRDEPHWLRVALDVRPARNLTLIFVLMVIQVRACNQG